MFRDQSAFVLLLRERRSLLLMVVLFVFVVLHGIASLTIPGGHFDDGIQLSGAMLLRRGQLPNIDYASVYCPLNPYLIAAAFSVLGESVVTYRIVQWCVTWVVIACVLVMSRCLRPARITGLGIVLVALLINCTLQERQVATGVMWSALTVTLLLATRSSQSVAARAGRIAAGITFAALCWTRPVFGAYLASAWCIDALRTYLDRTELSRRQLRAELSTFVVSACLAMGAMGMLWISWGGSLRTLAQDVLVAPQKAIFVWALQPVSGEWWLPTVRNVFLSGVLAVAWPVAWVAVLTPVTARGAWSRRTLWYLATLVALAALVVGWLLPIALPSLLLIPIAVAGMHHLRTQGAERAKSLLLLVTTLQLHYTLSRPDDSHFAAVFPMLAFAIVSALTYDERRVRRTLLALTVVLCGVSVAYNFKHVLWCVQHRSSGIKVLPALLRSNDALLSEGCGKPCDVFLDGDSSAQAAADYIRQRTSEQEAVFSGMLYQNELAGSDVSAYWLMRRRTATRHIMLMYGLTNGEREEHEIQTALATQHVHWLFLRSDEKTNDSPPVLSALDRYVRANYQLEKRFGFNEVWRRTTSD